MLEEDSGAAGITGLEDPPADAVAAAAALGSTALGRSPIVGGAGAVK